MPARKSANHGWSKSAIWPEGKAENAEVRQWPLAVAAVMGAALPIITTLSDRARDLLIKSDRWHPHIHLTGWGCLYLLVVLGFAYSVVFIPDR